MLGSALYFPHIDIRDPVWLRSTLLFWDDIQTIAPTAIQEPYLNDDTVICHEAGLLQPLRCDMYPELIEEIGRQVIRTADSRSSVSRAIRQVDQWPSLTISAARQAEHISNDVSEAIEELTGMHPQRVTPEIRELAVRYGLARMHTGKMPAHLREAFRGLEMARMHPEKLPYVLRDLMSQDYIHDDEGDWLLVDNRFASAYMAALASKIAQ